MNKIIFHMFRDEIIVEAEEWVIYKASLSRFSEILPI